MLRGRKRALPTDGRKPDGRRGGSSSGPAASGGGDDDGGSVPEQEETADDERSSSQRRRRAKPGRSALALPAEPPAKQLLLAACQRGGPA